jgi:5-methylcytosine-specific restriction endonuclease McrA
MTCRVYGCGREARYKADQLCQKHYFRQWRYGTTDTIKRGHAKPRIVTPNGYVRVYAADHPLAAHGYVFEHRKVAYDARGGKIHKCERCGIIEITWATCHVDHADDDRQNNAPANLWVTCRACNTMRGGALRRKVLLTCQGETKSTIEWSRDTRVQISSTAIRQRKLRGWSDEAAVFGERLTHVSQPPAKKRAIKFVDGKRVRA